jgi:hypothetical protein
MGWEHKKKAGWYAVLEDPAMPVTSTLLDQAHHAIDRKLFMMKAFHHPKDNQQAFLRGLAICTTWCPTNVVPNMPGSVGRHDPPSRGADLSHSPTETRILTAQVEQCKSCIEEILCRISHTPLDENSSDGFMYHTPPRPCKPFWKT